MRSISFSLITTMILYSCNLGNTDAGILTTDSVSITQDSLKTNPTNTALWLKLYDLQIAKEDTIGAINSLNEYLKLAPGDERAGLEFAWLLAYQKDSNAVNVSNWLINSNDQLTAVKALYIQAHYYGNIGNLEKSSTLLDEVIKNNYQFIDAYIQKGIILLDQQKPDEALKTLMLAYKIDPSNTDLYYWISQCHKDIGNKTEAEDWQKKYEGLK